jgi:hypothetical protein
MKEIAKASDNHLEFTPPMRKIWTKGQNDFFASYAFSVKTRNSSAPFLPLSRITDLLTHRFTSSPTIRLAKFIIKKEDPGAKATLHERQPPPSLFKLRQNKKVGTTNNSHPRS